MKRLNDIQVDLREVDLDALFPQLEDNLEPCAFDEQSSFDWADPLSFRHSADPDPDPVFSPLRSPHALRTSPVFPATAPHLVPSGSMMSLDPSLAPSISGSSSASSFHAFSLSSLPSSARPAPSSSFAPSLSIPYLPPLPHCPPVSIPPISVSSSASSPASLSPSPSPRITLIAEHEAFSNCSQKPSCSSCRAFNNKPVYCSILKDWMFRIEVDPASIPKQSSLSIQLAFVQESAIVKDANSDSGLSTPPSSRSSSLSSASSSLPPDVIQWPSRRGGPVFPAAHTAPYQRGLCFDFVGIYSNARERQLSGESSRAPKRVPCPVMPPARLVIRYALSPDGDASPSNLTWQTSFVSHVFKTISKPKYTRSNREVKHIFDDDDVAAADEVEPEVRSKGRERKERGKQKAKETATLETIGRERSHQPSIRSGQLSGVTAARSSEPIGYEAEFPSEATQRLHGTNLQPSIHVPSDSLLHTTEYHLPSPPPNLAPAMLFQEHQKLQHLQQQQMHLFHELQQQQQHCSVADHNRKQQLHQQICSLQQSLQQTEQLKQHLEQELLRCMQVPLNSSSPSRPSSQSPSHSPISPSSDQSPTSFASSPSSPSSPSSSPIALSRSYHEPKPDDHKSFSDQDAGDLLSDVSMSQYAPLSPSSPHHPSFSYISFSSSSSHLHHGRERLARLGVKDEHHDHSSKESWRSEERRRKRRERADAQRNSKLEQYFEALSLAVQDQLPGGRNSNHQRCLPYYEDESVEKERSVTNGSSRVDILQAAMVKIQQLERENARLRQEQAMAIIPSSSLSLGDIVRSSSWLMMSFDVNNDSFHEVSDSFLRLLGFERLEFLSMHPTRLGPPPCNIDLIHSLCKGVIPRVECRGIVVTKSQTTLNLKSTLYASRVANQVFVMCLSELLPDSEPIVPSIVTLPE